MIIYDYEDSFGDICKRKIVLKGMIANVITGCRIVVSLMMLLFSAYSPWFNICYLLAGVTDMVDGTIARKLGTCSEFGERFDTVADFVFVVVAAFKLLPVINIGPVIWLWIGIIAVIKVINIVIGFVQHKKIVAVHSWANRITGLLLFVLPFSIYVIDIKYFAAVVCLLATFAAVQEGYLIRNEILK